MKLPAWVSLKKRSVMLIDDDRDTRAAVTGVFSKYPEITLSEFDDGLTGWTACVTQKPPCDFIICGWTIPSLSGLALLNRMRQDEVYCRIPLLVVSDVIKRKDFKILEEFPVTALLEKPASDTRLIKAIEELIEERIWNDLNAGEIKKLFRDARNQPKDLISSMQRLLENAPNPTPIALMLAEALYDNNYLSPAERLYKTLIARDPNNLRALTGLGRVLYRLGKPDEAASHLRVAWRECQLNINRLCLLGEIDLINLNPDAARKHFSNALSIDEEQPQAKAGLELADSLNDHIRRNAGTKLPRTLASLANTLAITLVRDGDFDKGVAQYKAALQLLTEPAVAAKVMFNLGLAYMRWGKPSEAKPWFEASAAHGGEEFSKARAYSEQIGEPANKPASAAPAAPTPAAAPLVPTPSVPLAQIEDDLVLFDSEVIAPKEVTGSVTAADLDGIDLDALFEDENF